MCNCRNRWSEPKEEHSDLKEAIEKDGIGYTDHSHIAEYFKSKGYIVEKSQWRNYQISKDSGIYWG